MIIKRKGHIKIFEYLKETRSYGYKLAKILDMSQSCVCNYLRDLEKLNLIKGQIEKNENRFVKFYSINEEKLEEIEVFIRK